MTKGETTKGSSRTKASVTTCRNDTVRQSNVNPRGAALSGYWEGPRTGAAMLAWPPALGSRGGRAPASPVFIARRHLAALIEQASARRAAA